MTYSYLIRAPALFLGAALTLGSNISYAATSADLMGQIEDLMNYCEHGPRQNVYFNGSSLTIDQYLFGTPPIKMIVPIDKLESAEYTGGSILLQCSQPGCAQTVYPGLGFGQPQVERRTRMTLSICDIETNEKVVPLVNELIEQMN